MEFISEQAANEAKDRAALARKLAAEESYYASIGLSHPSKWAEEDRADREAEERELARWRKTDDYKRRIAQLRSGKLLRILPL
jgi:hypothetical protein